MSEEAGEYRTTACGPVEAMLDIETLDTQAGGVVWEIGVVFFDRNLGAEVGGIFVADCQLRVMDQVLLGMTVDPATALWTAAHGVSAETLEQGRMSPREALEWLADLWERKRPTAVWAWGADFEGKMLEALAKKAGGRLPWKFHDLRCARTVWWEAFPGVRHSDQKHRALADASKQAGELCQALQELGRTAAKGEGGAAR